MNRKSLIFPGLILAAFLVGYIALPRMNRKPVKIIDVAHADSKLQRAAKEAQSRLTEFRQRLRSSNDLSERFAIKARFKTKFGSEYLWLKDPIIDGLGFQATVDQVPVVAELHRGDKVSVSEADVFDWMIKGSSGKIEGGFTENALSR